MKTVTTVVWATRHQPSKEQKLFFGKASKHVALTGDALTFQSGTHAWEEVLKANGGQAPTYVVGVIPVGMIADYLKVAGETPLLRAVMNSVSTPKADGGEPTRTYQWAGSYEQIKKVEVVTAPFTMPVAPEVFPTEALLECEPEEILAELVARLLTSIGGRVIESGWCIPARKTEEFTDLCEGHPFDDNGGEPDGNAFLLVGSGETSEQTAWLKENAEAVVLYLSLIHI